MNIVIVGCGKVGLMLARQLVDEGHDVTVMDTDSNSLKGAESLDVQLIVGNGTSFRSQSEAGVDQADIFIAVTDQDEINLLSCLIAKKTSAVQTIARVRNPQYFEEIDYIQKCMGTSLVINPEFAAATEIDHLIRTPSAMEVDTFARGLVELLKLQIPEDSELNGMAVPDFSAKFQRNVLVCIIERGKECFIPDGRAVLQGGDKLYVIVPPKEISRLSMEVGLPYRPLKNVMIVGGSKISYYLTKKLARTGISVKIVEKDSRRCDELSEILPEASIIYGDATEYELLREEGLAQMDAFVALTNIDEENVFLSMYAAKHAPKCKKITKNNRLDLSEFSDSLDIGSVVAPKDITAEYISRYVRSQQNNYSSAIEAVYKLADGKVEALEFLIKEDSEITGTPLQELNLKKNILVCCIVRGHQIITPGGSDTMERGDKVIMVTTHRNLNDIGDILA